MTKSSAKLNTAFLIFGSNTDVGKTLFSAYVSMFHARAKRPLRYVKIVQSGYPADDDASLVEAVAPGTQASAFVRLPEPLSPHRCTGAREPDCGNEAILSRTRAWLQSSQAGEPSLALLETAGGVLSPMPGGDPCSEVLRPLRLPAILIGDPKLGGISQTLSAWESLRLKGYSVPLVVLFKGDHANADWLRERLRHTETRVHELALPLPSRTVANESRGLDVEIRALAIESLAAQAEAIRKHFDQHMDAYASMEAIVSAMEAFCVQREQGFRELGEIASNHIWWPFTQHRDHPQAKLIDSAYGSEVTEIIETDEGFKSTARFDASCSWWTLGVGHGHPEATLETAAALGRYGHVLFPGNVHEPAARLTEQLIEGVGRGWAERVFFSDNGSTAVEVALKMAFRLSESRGLLPTGEHPAVIGYEDSYHGDTLGAVNATNPNAFKARDRWYRPSGLWLRPSTWLYHSGAWHLRPSGGENVVEHRKPDLASIFDLQRRASEERDLYLAYRTEATERLEAQASVAAVLIEPVIQGSGGMLFVDPLSQRALCEVAREKGIPIIFDEVFSGFFRLGVESAASLLGFAPDVACYSKALTGGLLPTSVTLARREVFEAFLGEGKSDALLHGHSYTAHPAGCAAALESLRLYRTHLSDREDRTEGYYWPKDRLQSLTELKAVEGLVSIGPVLALQLRSSAIGYLATAGARYLDSLSRRGVSARPLGNIIYMMCHPLAEPKDLLPIFENFYLSIKETGS